MQEHRFRVGDKARITKKKKAFERGYTLRCTEDDQTFHQSLLRIEQTTNGLTCKVFQPRGQSRIILQTRTQKDRTTHFLFGCLEGEPKSMSMEWRD